jgi:hypothetical protein
MPPSFPYQGGGGGFGFLNKNSSKKVVTLRVGGTGSNPAFKRSGTNPGLQRSTTTSRQTTTGFERPTLRFKSEGPNHWTVLAYLFWNKIF